MVKANKILQMGLGLLLGLQPTIGAAAPAMQIKDQILSLQAVAPDGSVWMASQSKVQHLNTDGTLVEEFWAPYNNIGDIALASDGSVWLIELSFNPTTALKHFTVEGTLISQFQVPLLSHFLGIAIAPDGSIWATDWENKRIQHYQADGLLIAQFSIQGVNVDVSTLLLERIAVAKDGSVWVTEGETSIPGSTFPTSYRWQHYSADGEFITQIVGQATAQFGGIADLAIAADGSVWVADNTSFQHYQADGTFIGKLNSYGEGTATISADQVKLAADGSLWTVGSISSYPGVSFLKHINADGSVIAQFRTRGNCSAEYDDVQQTVYLWDVAVGTQYYDAVLQFQNGSYNLVSATEHRAGFPNWGLGCNFGFAINRLAVFDTSSNLLTIRKVQAIDKQYQASFKYLGNNVFNLQSTTLLGN